MDLKNTINNTNTHKENIKTVATQIDNKLVELGGEQATDLSDVANKMGAMVTGNYKKVADVEINSNTYKHEYYYGDGNSSATFTIPFNPLSFNPSKVYVHMTARGGGRIGEHESLYEINKYYNFKDDKGGSEYVSMNFVINIQDKKNLIISSNISHGGNNRAIGEYTIHRIIAIE